MCTVTARSSIDLIQCRMCKLD